MLIPRLFFKLIVFIGGVFVFQSCQQEEAPEPKVFSSLIVDFPHLNGPNRLFYSADSLKWIHKYQASNEAFQKILERKSLLPLKDSLYCLNQIAYNHLWLNEYDKAVKNMDLVEHRLMQSELDLPFLTSDFHYNKGWLLKEKRKGKEAFSQLFKAKALYDSIYPSPHLKQIEVLNEIGFTYREFSNHLDSCIYFIDEAERIYNSKTEFKSYGLKTYFGIAMISLFNRDHIKGMAAIDLVLSMAQSYKLRDTIFIGRMYSVKGDLFRKLDNKSASINAHDRAIALGEAKSNKNERLQEFYRNKMILHLYEQDSLEFFNLLKKIEDNFTEKEIIYANKNRLLGKYWEVKGQYEKSIKFTNKAISHYESIEYPDNLFFKRALFSISRAFRGLGEYDSAAYYLQYNIKLERPQGLELNNVKDFVRKHLTSDKVNFVTLGEMANCFVKGYELAINKEEIFLEKSLLIYEAIDSVMFHQLRVFEEDVSLVFQKEFANLVFPEAIKAAFWKYEISHQIKYLDLANKFIERLKSTVAYQDVVSLEIATDSLIRQELYLKTALKKRKILLTTSSQKTRMELNKEILILRDDLAELDKSIKQAFPYYHSLKTNQVIPKYNSIAPYLRRKNISTLQYFIGIESWYVIVMTPDTFIYHQSPIPPNFDIVIQDFKEELSNSNLNFQPQNIQKLVVSGQKIYEEFFQPIDSILTQKIIVIQDKELNALPFDCLVIPDSVERFINLKEVNFLLKEHQISYEYSLKSLWKDLQSPLVLPNDPKVLAYAFSSSNASEKLAEKRDKVGELFYSFEEVQSISTAFGPDKVTSFFGQKSTKSRFLHELAEQWDIIHFALHSTIDKTKRYNNRILFRTEQEKDSVEGLFAYEIPNLNLKANLIVLSSCSSANGKYQEGEGVYTLAKAFKQANAQNVVSSFWEIDDYTTFILMKYFYTNIADKMNVSEALWKAKLDFINMENHQLQAPYFWSGIVNFGC